MLVLTRKTEQQIQIGNNIVITILQIRGQTVRVGIEAPRDVRVVRAEISGKARKSVASAERQPANNATAKRSEGIDADGRPVARVNYCALTASGDRVIRPSGGLIERVRRRVPGATSRATMTPASRRLDPTSPCASLSQA